MNDQMPGHLPLRPEARQPVRGGRQILPLRNLKNGLLYLGLGTLLTACGGGSSPLRSDGEGSATSPASLPEPALGSAASAWSDSAEYQANRGLALINAAQGYAARTTGRAGGEGVKIAIIDSGVDGNHDDLQSDNFSFDFDIPDTTDDHGSHVGGIAAAARNGQGMHGVAYNAELVSIKALRDIEIGGGFVIPSVGDSDEVALAILSAAGLERTVLNTNPLAPETAIVTPVESFRDGISRTVIASNKDAEADIVNMSLGGPDPDEILAINGRARVGSQPMFAAMEDAAGQNKLMVAALGNEGIDGASGAPAQYVDRGKVRGFALAVGALNESGTAPASFSNTCGGLEYCLFAPGENILSTLPGGSYAEFSGTSMAAPMVSGALAVLMAAFPNQPPEALVQRLLDTARPMGSRAIFGAGALDLGAAMTPVGAVSVPEEETVDGQASELATSGLDLPAHMNVELASGELDALTLDSQGFQFRHDLGGWITVRSNAPSGLERFLAIDGSSNHLASLGDPALGLDIAWQNSELAPVDDSQNVFGQNFRELFATRQESEGLTMRLALGSDTTLTGNIGRPVHSMVQDELANRMGAGFAAPSGARLSFGAIGSANQSFGVQHALGENDRLGLSLRLGEVETGSHSRDRQLVDMALTGAHERSNGGLAWTMGILTERGSTAGIAGEGAFGHDGNGGSVYGDVLARLAVSSGIDLLAGYSVAHSRSLRDGGGLVEKIDDTLSDARLIGLAVTPEPIDPAISQRFSASLFQPLAARTGGVGLRLPVIDDADGQIAYREHQLSFVPEDRETVLQFMFEHQDSASQYSVSFGTYARLNPDHDAQAPPDLGLGMRLDLDL